MVGIQASRSPVEKDILGQGDFSEEPPIAPATCTSGPIHTASPCSHLQHSTLDLQPGMDNEQSSHCCSHDPSDTQYDSQTRLMKLVTKTNVISPKSKSDRQPLWGWVLPGLREWSSNRWKSLKEQQGRAAALLPPCVSAMPLTGGDADLRCVAHLLGAL